MNSKELSRKLKKRFFTGIGVIVALLICTLSMCIYRANHEPPPIMAHNEDTAACCSEERMISIYEGIESLEESYDTVQYHIYHRDSINTNAITIKKMWEDSVRIMNMSEEAKNKSTKPL